MKSPNLSRSALPLCCVVIAACSQSTSLDRLQYTPNAGTAERGASRTGYGVLHSFGKGTDGSFPRASLIDIQGTLYGTTAQGGANSAGTVFSVAASGTEKVLHSFGKGKDGNDPTAGLIDLNGTLYGTTFYGGKYGGAYGLGTVFSITTGGKEKVLHNFGNKPDGHNPNGSLIDVGGALYGTTSAGGAHGGGTLFSITKGGTEKVLYSFGQGKDGRTPDAGLVDVNGTLYGTTSAGGTYCSGSGTCGTVFSYASGTENLLYSFGSGTDGAMPVAGLIDVSGTLYGTTEHGGTNGQGTVFSITTSGTENVLHSFGGSGTDGSLPVAGLVNVNGVLYGTTTRGGTHSCVVSFTFPCGTVFSMTTSGTENVVHNFGYGKDGSDPQASLTYKNGTLFGTTAGGGAHGAGTVFSLTP